MRFYLAILLQLPRSSPLGRIRRPGIHSTMNLVSAFPSTFPQTRRSSSLVEHQRATPVSRMSSTSGTTSSWSIDDTRENFQFGCELGREIKNGKLGKLIQSPTYSGKTIDLWNSRDGLGNQSLWKLWGTPNCGKGQPAQNGRVGQGTPPARFRQVKVGD